MERSGVKNLDAPKKEIIRYAQNDKKVFECSLKY
jgi:hypothetical protein